MDTPETVERLDVETRDVERAHETIRDTFAGHRLLIRGSQEHFRYRQTTASAGTLGVHALEHTMGVREEVDPVQAAWIGVVARGRLALAHTGEETRARPGDVVLFPQGVRFTLEWPVLELRIVGLPHEELARRAAARSGIDPADFRFHNMAPLSAALGRHCANTIGYLRSLFAGDAPPVAEPLILAAAVDTAAAAVLTSFPNNAATDAPGGPAGHAAPAAVRRAVDYIDAHADRPLTLGEIAAASGIGGRALQQAFRQHRDTTPTAYLRDARLERAHRELQAADPTRGATVAGIATRWGFAHRGRFAAAYRQAYGRSPQQTLLS